MEVAIVFHFAGRGGSSRLALVDFAQLLNPKWRAPQSFTTEEKDSKKKNVLNQTFHSMYNFALGGMLIAGGSHNQDDLPCDCKVSLVHLVPQWYTPLILLRCVMRNGEL